MIFLKMLDSLPGKNPAPESVLWICSSCIGDSFLKREIEKEGLIHKCFFCDVVNPSIKIDVLAEYVVGAFYSYVTCCNSPDDKETGVTPEIAVSQLLKSDKPVGEVVFQVLRQKYASDHIKEQGWDAFDPNCLYKFAISFLNIKNAYWDIACQSLKSKSRFFNEEMKEILESIFKNVPKSALKVIGCDSDFRFYRARISNNEKHVCEILQNPAKQFGPTPLGNVFGGRMNPVGIPVLYTALEQDTALAEVRPHLDATVVIASLTPLRELTLLDLTALGDYEIDASPFNPHVQEELNRICFSEEFSKLLARPVNPQSDSIEYLPTQCVADYLENFFTPKVDGFICHSAMRKGGKNVIFFRDSLTIQIDNPLAISSVEFEEPMPWEPESVDTFTIHFDNAVKKEKSYKKPVLKLVNQDIIIKKISQISYSSHSSTLRWEDSPKT